MKFYCGIDLSARDCHVCVIDEQLKIVVQQKLRNELPKIVQLLEPARGLHLSGRDPAGAGPITPAPAFGPGTSRRVWRSATIVAAPGNPLQQTAGDQP